LPISIWTNTFKRTKEWTIKGLIFHIQRFSVHDGPGIRTTVFLKGCPLHCAWCHNPESIAPVKEIALHSERCIRCGECFAVCESHAIRQGNGSFKTFREFCMSCGTCIDVCAAEVRTLFGKEVSTDEVMEEIRKDIVFYDQSGGGATFSGGEPLLQHEFLSTLLDACRTEEIHTTVDTTGFTSPAILERIGRATDLFLYDIKTIDDAKHIEYTGVSNGQILENARRLAGWHKNIIVRVPLIPQFNDGTESLHSIGKFTASLKTVKEMHVMPYHQSGIEKYKHLEKEYTMGSTTPPPPEKLDEAVKIFQLYIPLVTIGG
jgi:pyruvate formate lyase activating enzyme